MEKRLQLIVGIIATTICLTLAQPGDPGGPGGDPGGGSPVPLGGIEILLAAGGALGAKKIMELRKRMSDKKIL